MKEYLKTGEEVLREQSVDAGQGLSEAEVAGRLSKHGKNKLVEAKKTPIWKRFLEQLADPMIIILIAAAAVSGVTAVYAGESFADVIIILAVVIINAVLGVVQESKAEAAIAALQEIAAATSKVIRGGHQLTVRSEELVPGDIIVLEAGDSVPADARIVECASMKIEEAALTGESVPVLKTTDQLAAEENGKDVSLGDRKNMVYMGSSVAYGRGRAVVTATGMDTEMGKIADALTLAKDNATPLQMKLAQLSKVLSFLVIGICVIIFGVSLVRAYPDVSGEVMLDTFMVAVSLAVAAIPEGLAAVVTIVLSIGVTNMSKKAAIVRKLTAVETLGCTQIICSDKTGTLTQNKMTVVEHTGQEEKLLAIAMSLCNDAGLDENHEAVGEPTEAALVNYAWKAGLNKNRLVATYPRIGEAPFDSMRKMMSTVHRMEDGTVVQFTKGAPDEILKRCTQICLDGQAEELTEDIRASILKENKAMADKALRVLGAAMRTWEEEPSDYGAEVLEQDLCFLGLTGMIDPVRPEVKPAIDECRAAGIRPIMITGDHKDTAVAIAMQLGIIDDASQAITGSQLDDISDEELENEIERYSVYARVQPEHKVRIVNAWQKRGKITAMTGDGVNDAPSIKNADIGVGMGITGTDVTKNVADMVLADDNFATIAGAIAQGRSIYENIRKSVLFLLSSNFGEIITMLAAVAMGLASPLKSSHILWINLITDSLPALALGVDVEKQKDYMNRPPRRRDESLFAGGGWGCTCFYGLLIAGISMLAFLQEPVGTIKSAGMTLTIPHLQAVLKDAQVLARSQTYAFTVLGMAQLFHAIGMRDVETSVFCMNHLENRLMLAAFVVGIGLQLMVTEVPYFVQLFGTCRLTALEWTKLLGLAAMPLLAHELLVLLSCAGEVKDTLRLQGED